MVFKIISGSLSIDVLGTLDFSNEQAVGKKPSITYADTAGLLKLYK